jgi:hypothetical protein
MSVRILLCATCLVLAAGDVRAEDAKVEKARADVEARRDRVAWAERMVKKGYISDAQLREERTNLAVAEAALRRAEWDAKRPEGFFAELAHRYATQILTARLKVERTQAALDMLRERAAWADRMVKLKYMSSAQAQADRTRADAAADELRKATEALDALRPRPDK